MVAEVYFSLNRFPTGLRTCLCRTTNCWKVDLSLNKIFPKSSAVQWRCFLANPSLFFFIMGVNFGFFAGLEDFNPNSLLSRRETVLILTSVSFLSKFARSFLQELVGERATILFMAMSSRAVVFRGLPLFFSIAKNPFCGKFFDCPLNRWSVDTKLLRNLGLRQSIFVKYNDLTTFYICVVPIFHHF